jgi:hypothetical protein
MSETTNTEPVEIEVHVGRDPEDEDPREETLADHLAAIEAMGVPGVPLERIAERCFDAMCCGAKAEHLPFIGNDEVLALALIDLLFAKLSDAREADAAEARGDEPSIDHGDGWRLLRKGEVIEAGDEVGFDDGTWEESLDVGLIHLGGDEMPKPRRRRITTTTTKETR